MVKGIVIGVLFSIGFVGIIGEIVISIILVVVNKK